MSVIKDSFRDIRFWIILFFLIRLVGITNPPLEVEHNWRQTSVAMVARNFLEVDNNILYPRIDIAGNKSGITGMEFPLLNYSIYLVAEIFGYQHWYGRLINLIVSSFGLFVFFKLINKYFEKKTAFYATLILLFSLWFSYSRKIMPDTFSMSFLLAGIYFGTNYLDKSTRSRQLINLMLYATFVTLGVLSKISSVYLLAVFLIPLLDKEILLKRKYIFILVTGLSGILPLLWYFYWVPYLVETYGFWYFFMGKSISVGVIEIANNLPETLLRFFETAIKFIAFAVFLYGLIMGIIKKNKLLTSIFLLSFLSYLIIVFKAGETFPRHSYYMIPFIPVMALVAGYGLNLINNRKFQIVLIVAIGVEGILNQHYDFRIKDQERTLLLLEDDMNRVSQKEDLIMVNSGQNPTPMYFAHRKGWVESNDKIKDERYIQSLKVMGLKYIVILKKTFGTNINLAFPVVLENEDYCIYKL